jgi:hypothetical protein
MGKRREGVFQLPESMLPVEGESHSRRKLAVSDVTHLCDGRHFELRKAAAAQRLPPD